jgi:hypothetical protein
MDAKNIARVYRRVWLDHPVIGCGNRDMLVLSAGRKWTRLLCVARMRAIKLPTAQVPAGEEIETSKTRLRKRLKENAKTYNASKALLRDALAVANTI